MAICCVRLLGGSLMVAQWVMCGIFIPIKFVEKRVLWMHQIRRKSHLSQNEISPLISFFQTPIPSYLANGTNTLSFSRIPPPIHYETKYEKRRKKGPTTASKKIHILSLIGGFKQNGMITKINVPLMMYFIDPSLFLVVA